MIFDEELNNKISTLVNMRKQNHKKICELLLDENVREFYELLKSNEELSKSIDSKERELLHHKFETCNHAYVMTDISMVNGENHIYKCVKCGLTNENLVRGDERVLSYPYSLMGTIFCETFHKSILIYDGLNDIPFEEIAKIYEVIVSEYPDISLLELRDKIKKEASLIKQMINK